MEGYKKFRDVVLDAATNANEWRYAGDGNLFTKDELLEMADVFDGQFPAGDWNYFVCFPDGEIGLLSTEDNEIEQLFLPNRNS